MNAEIYLDNNATTRVAPECLDATLACLRDAYGNPSSKHRAGERAQRLVNEARVQVAELLGAAPAEVVFTSGGTESNHLAILGALARDSAGTYRPARWSIRPPYCCSGTWRHTACA
jgi:cysteine desulfurase